MQNVFRSQSGEPAMPRHIVSGAAVYSQFKQNCNVTALTNRKCGYNLGLSSS